MTAKKKITLLCLSSLAVSAFIAISTLTFSMRGQNVLAEPVETTATEKIGFVLKDYDGELALFRENSDTPYKTLRVPVNFLTEYDRELVKDGIRADTEQELRKVIEDLTS